MADDFYRARSTFVCNTGKGLRTVKRDSLVSGDDPAYKNAPHLFQSVSDAVEQATAAPGEKRTLNSPHLIREAAKKATSSGRRGGKKADEKPADEAPEQPEQPPATDAGEGQGSGDENPADPGEAPDGTGAAQ